MKQEDFNKIVALKNRLDSLEKAKENIGKSPEYRLSYIRENTVQLCYSAVDTQNLSAIKNILERHDALIRKEVEEEIRKVLKEIEAL